MHRGYTKRWRKRWDKEYHHDLLLFVMMDYFIDFANWKDKEFPFVKKGVIIEMIKVKRGQCFFTYKGLADFLNGPLNPVSRKMVKRRVGILDKIGFLDLLWGHQYQIATILNYNLYNPIENNEGHLQGHNRDITGTQQGHQGDTTNKDKKYKKEKKDNIGQFLPPGGDQLKLNGHNWIDVESWNKFIKHREEIKKPVTETSVSFLLEVLKENRSDQKQIIKNSIMAGYPGLYPLKNKDDDGGWDKLRKEFCGDEKE